LESYVSGFSLPALPYGSGAIGGTGHFQQNVKAFAAEPAVARRLTEAAHDGVKDAAGHGRHEVLAKASRAPQGAGFEIDMILYLHRIHPSALLARTYVNVIMRTLVAGRATAPCRPPSEW
jgi:hypothetical protein